jgi:hypothetical protein
MTNLYFEELEVHSGPPRRADAQGSGGVIAIKRDVLLHSGSGRREYG